MAVQESSLCKIELVEWVRLTAFYASILRVTQHESHRMGHRRWVFNDVSRVGQ